MPPRNVRPNGMRSAFRSSTTRRRFLLGSATALSSVLLTNCTRNLRGADTDTGTTDTEPSPSPAASDNGTLHIYSWSSYIDDEALRAFEAQTGIRPIVDIYDSNEAMLARMQAGGGTAYSIIYPSDYMVAEMIEMDMLTELDRSRLNGLDELKSQWQNPVYDPNNTHSVPYAWGTTGLIYDPEVLGEEITEWDYLWQNRDRLNRQITLLNDVRETKGAALKYLGYSYNSTDPEEIEAAFEALMELRPAVANFLSDGWQDQLAGGDLLVSMAYSVDALTLMDEYPNLVYVIPEEGSSVWTDTMVIPDTAPNVDAAYEWINFMLDSDNSASLVERLKFSTPLESAFNKLPDDLRSDTNLFPSDEILDRCEGIAPISEDALVLYDRYWTQLTS
jgi:spermidine/putrescine transport system substrate-binding protein